MSNLDFISRSELLAEIDNERRRHIDSGNYGAEHLMVHSMRRLVEEAPAVDAAPVMHGRWDEPTGFKDGFWVCSACNFCTEATAAPTLYKYCPNCGAKMDEEESDV